MDEKLSPALITAMTQPCGLPTLLPGSGLRVSQVTLPRPQGPQDKGLLDLRCWAEGDTQPAPTIQV